MSSAKWSGIEQKKYGLTARWYVSAYYGNDIDVDAVGLYNPSTNPTGHGGPTRPFATLEKASQQDGSAVIVIDSGFYSISSNLSKKTWIGDGNVIISSSQSNISLVSGSRGYNIMYVGAGAFKTYGTIRIEDCTFLYSTISDQSTTAANCTFIESIFVSLSPTSANKGNCSFIRCVGTLAYPNNNINNIFVSCQDLSFSLNTVRPVSRLADYSVLIGTVKTSSPVNGKTTGVTIEDFKAHGQYFRKSHSEVDLFGNASGSGASVAQLNTIFNNFYYPYIDDWQYLDLSLRPDVDDRVRYGGLNGHFIGALPVGHHFDIPTLWNTYQDVVNTTNVELNMMDRLIRTNPAIPGVYTSTTIALPNVIDETDVAMFFKNNVYDSNGVAVQRLDYSVDPAKDAALEQRTVYSYRMKTSPDDVTPLTDWKEYELDRAPTVDASGNSNIDDLFDSATETKQRIKRFIIEITLRSE